MISAHVSETVTIAELDSAGLRGVGWRKGSLARLAL